MGDQMAPDAFRAAFMLLMASFGEAYSRLSPEQKARADADLRTRMDFWSVIAAEFPDDEL